MRHDGAQRSDRACVRFACSAVQRRRRAGGDPERPIRILVGFAPGGPTDILARLIGQWLTDRFGQQVVIENKPGAGGNIATEAAIDAPADGYTLLVLATANAINATYYPKLPYDFLRDVTGVAGLARVPSVLEVNPSVPVKTTAEFIAYAKANPSKVNVASGGTGTTAHLAIELFKTQTQINLVHVPYRGLAPALTDLISGQVQAMFGDTLSSLAHIKSGCIAAARGYHRAAHSRTGGRTDRCGNPAGFRGLGLVRHRRTERNAAAGRRTAERRNQRRPEGRQNQRPDRRTRRHAPRSCRRLITPSFLASETAKWATAVKAAGVKADQ